MVHGRYMYIYISYIYIYVLYIYICVYITTIITMTIIIMIAITMMINIYIYIYNYSLWGAMDCKPTYKLAAPSCMSMSMGMWFSASLVNSLNVLEGSYLSSGD